MKLVENRSSEELDKIASAISKITGKDEFLKEFDAGGGKGAKGQDAYIRGCVGNWYDENELYESDDGASFLALSYSEGMDIEYWSVPRPVRKSIPRRIRRAFCAQLAEDEKSRIQFEETPHMRCELFAPAGYDLTSDTAADMFNFVCYQARVRSCPALFDTCDPETADFLVSLGASEYNRVRLKNGIGRFYLVWRPSQIEIPEVVSRNVYLVDTSQVGNLWVHLLDKPLGYDRIVLFYNNGNSPVTLSDLRTVLEKGSRHISWIQCDSGQPMSAQITTQLGYMLSEAPKNHYYVLSSDADFNVVRQYWANQDTKILQLTPSQLRIGEAGQPEEQVIPQQAEASGAENTAEYTENAGAAEPEESAQSPENSEAAGNPDVRESPDDSGSAGSSEAPDSSDEN
ncbi:MAG: PIN domain-containing protein [Lachnospiraceae bacterium]|jgi:hypothetical protein